nr:MULTISPECIES: hypothetical protein [unclassified Nostoc]
MANPFTVTPISLKNIAYNKVTAAVFGCATAGIIEKVIDRISTDPGVALVGKGVPPIVVIRVITIHIRPAASTKNLRGKVSTVSSASVCRVIAVICVVIVDVGVDVRGV